MNKTNIIINSIDEGTFKMSEMSTGQICIIDHRVSIHHGKYVMRTLNKIEFEVMLLEDFNDGVYWASENNHIKVREAPKGTKIIFEVI